MRLNCVGGPPYESWGQERDRVPGYCSSRRAPSRSAREAVVVRAVRAIAATAGDRPLVSVIVPFHNVEAFLEEAIRSVLAQTYGPIELLLCDDGSTDDSSRIAIARAQEFPSKIRYLRHPNHRRQGASSARNLGINASLGSIVAFLDADDAWAPTHLEDDVGLLERHPSVGVVCGQAIAWRSWSDRRSPDDFLPLAFPPGAIVEPPDMLVALLRRGEFCTPTCNLIVRKAVLERVGGFEERFRWLYEDQVLLAKLYLSESCLISGSRTALYRKRPDSSTAKAIRRGVYNPGRPHRSRELFLRWLSGRPELSQVGPDYDEIRQLISADLAPYATFVLRVRWRLLSVVRGYRAIIKDAHLRPLLALRRSLRGLATASLRSAPERCPQDVLRQRFFADNGHAAKGAVLAIGDTWATSAWAKHGVRTIEAANGEGLRIALSRQPSAGYDCILISESRVTRQDLLAVATESHRLLRTGGTLLGFFRVEDYPQDQGTALTTDPMNAAYAQLFGASNVEMRLYPEPPSSDGTGRGRRDLRYTRAGAEFSAGASLTIRALRSVAGGPVTDSWIREKTVGLG